MKVNPMLSLRKSHECDGVRTRLLGLLGVSGGVWPDWLLRHIANCPRCRRRMQAISRADLAMALLKAQPCKPDLLMRANKRALAMLKRDARNTTEAQAACHMLPKPSAFVRARKYFQPIVNAAACLVVVALVRVGITSSAAVSYTHLRAHET